MPVISTRTVLQSICLLCASITTSYGQLKVLSTGNSNDQWKSTQLQLIEQQLSDQLVKGVLRKELESQKTWLTQWSAGQLKTSPWAKQRKSDQRLVEPTIDPNKLATALREKLFGKNAKPTVADTQALQNLMDKKSEDVGVLQLYLHWIDQKQYRDEYAEKVVATAESLAVELAKQEEQTEEVRLARAFCYYRGARALAHMESPEMQTKKPIKDQAKFEAQLLSLYNELGELVGHDRPEFILLEIRMLRRDHWNGQALMLLEENAEILETQWYLRYRRDLLNDLGWSLPAKEAEAIAANPTADKR